MNLGDGQGTSGVTDVLQDTDDVAPDPHLERIKNQAESSEDSDEEVHCLLLAFFLDADLWILLLSHRIYLSFTISCQDEDFVLHKDDGGSPTDDSGGEESDASESGGGKQVVRFLIFCSKSEVWSQLC